MALSDFKFYAGMSPEKFAQSIGIDTDGYAFMWYRAEDITPVDDGYTFEFWPEAIKGNDSAYLLQQPGVTRFRYYSNILNGYPSMRGDAGNPFMVAADPCILGSNVLSMNFYIFGVIQNDGVAANQSYGIGTSTSPQLGIGLSTFSQFKFNSNTITSGISATNFPWTILFGSRTSTGTIRNIVSHNNLDIASSATNPASTSGDWNVRFNSLTNTTGEGANVNGYLTELLMFVGGTDFFLTDSQLSEINYYLSSKYNITLQAPEVMSRFYYPDNKNAFRPQLNESLAVPLPYSPDGYFCRSAELPSGDTDGYATLTRHSLADGYFIGLDNTQAISLRAWVRASGLVPNGKSQIVLFSHMDDPWKGYSTDNFIAYGLKFGTIENDGYAALGLRLAVRDSIGDVDALYQDINCTGTYTADTWYRIRMDVLPVGSAEDRITVYTGTGDTDVEVWTPVGSRTVSSGQSVYRSKTQYNEQGYFVAHVEESGSSATTKYYIDRFQVRLKDI